ncbi:hypothetical protein E2C05_13725 [Paracraurococcus ruber]|uniref:leucine-rich repeat domain-containing protein n=1 Tax=Paracraurococcus ruber TaxID=77675 RepID=UPI0010577DC6|nr:leucine-rich repeat domain-containing protein [Paracraurococcus ruber]TDG30641.1 hypothetical protein E2C05_13725 [Paracraurococcus ruber]
MARNPAPDPRRAEFAALFDGHLRAGTRPDPDHREPWSNAAFARAMPGRGTTTGVSDRSVANWRRGHALPAEIEPILRLLFGPLRADGGEARIALRAAWERPRMGEAAARIAAEPPEPDAVTWVEDGDRLAIAPGAETDAAASADPAVARRHRGVVERLQDLVEAIGQRLDNQRAWKGLARAARRALAAAEVPTAELPDVLVDLYDNIVSMGGFVTLDDALAADPAALDPALDPDIRRALADCLAVAAPWLRSFPSALQWDSGRRDFLARPELFEPVRATLPLARQVLEAARAEGAISAEDAARAALPLDTADLPGMQGEKAGYRGLANARALVTRAAAVTAAFLSGAVASDYATRSALVQHLGGALARAEEAAGALLAEAPADLRAAIRHVFAANRARREGDLPEVPGTTLPVQPRPAEPPPDLQEIVEGMILAGARPPEAWVPFIEVLDFDHSKLDDLAPLAGLASLRTLWIGRTQVSDLAPLAGLASLQTLWLDNTQVSDLAPLAGLASLQTLTLGNTQVSDLAPLAKLASLQTLRLDNTQVSDLAPLAGRRGLTIHWRGREIDAATLRP